ncbi:golgin subfamily A member 2 [Bradysia coprophila]|uniref:golgin subfamily A member 2 n=1 Tax=Bradysia coprophila TaxID=38358 RepID=UPI00187D85AA|nr:golgin subfamily A member 2 [Bradysia coprophila]
MSEIKLSKSEKIAAAKKKLKEFQTRQKPDPAQNVYTEIPSAETPRDTPQNGLTSSFTSTAYPDQGTIPQQNYDSAFGTDTGHTNFSAYFNSPVNSDAQQNLFQGFGEQLQQQQQEQQQIDTYSRPRSNEMNEFTGIQQQTTFIPEPHSLTTQETTQMSSPQFIDHFGECATVPLADATNQLSDELQATTSKLSAALDKNNELAGQLTEQSGLIDRLQLELHKVKLENSVKTNLDAESLKGQLDAHAQTIGILVGEKAELTAALTKYQGLAHSNASEVEELQGRLNASRHRVSVLERDIGNMKSSHEKYDTTQQKLCDELEQCQEEIKKFKKIVSDSEEEIAELKRSSTLKAEKIGSLEQELKKRSSELELSKLRVEQLSIGDGVQSEGQLENLSAEKLFYEQKTHELEGVVQQLNAEREQSGQQYQNYVQQLNQEIAKLAQQLQEYVADNERLSKREQALVKHVGELERQIQQQFNKQKRNAEMSVSTEEIEALKSRCGALEEEKAKSEAQQQSHLEQISSLQLQLQEKITLLSDTETTMERIQSERPDSKNLIASIESDKVAASRAMSQNQDLKQQLDEMQRAFVQVSNDKLELTDRLQSEQHLGREIRLRFDGMDSELSSLKEKLHFKDEEMIRLSHENVDLNKQILQLTQELDRLRHFEAKNASSNVLQQQLIIANEKIKKLRSRVQEFEEKEKLDGVAKTETAADGTVENPETDSENRETTVQAEERDADSPETDSVGSTINIATEEAMEKLQERFTRTMTEVANLTEEKHRLEHLVMQLQGETETIGEYITLYQQQRRLLKQREVEKDVQVQQIICDKEIMKDKLSQLNRLVEQLLQQNGVQQTDKIFVENFGDNNNSSELQPQTNGLDDTEVNENVSKVDDTKQSADTASKILNLLSEIQDNNRNPNFMKSVSDVHHCACCYGKLEVV